MFELFFTFCKYFNFFKKKLFEIFLYLEFFGNASFVTRESFPWFLGVAWELLSETKSMLMWLNSNLYEMISSSLIFKCLVLKNLEVNHVVIFFTIKCWRIYLWTIKMPDKSCSSKMKHILKNSVNLKWKNHQNLLNYHHICDPIKSFLPHLSRLKFMQMSSKLTSFTEQSFRKKDKGEKVWQQS